jgi:hypothetical protein
MGQADTLAANHQRRGGGGSMTTATRHAGETEDHRPPFPLGGPTSASWREQALSRIAELRFVSDWMLATGDYDETARMSIRLSIDEHLAAAAQAAKGGSIWRPGEFVAALTGSGVERVISQLDAVESELLRVAPPGYLAGEIASLLAHVQLHLRPNDPRRLRFEAIAAHVFAADDRWGVRVGGSPPARSTRLGAGSRRRAESADAPTANGASAAPVLTEPDRQAVISAVRAASLESRWKVSRLRSFRNVIVVASIVLTIAVAGMTVFAFQEPSQLPLCFIPGNVVCTTSTTPVSTGGRPGVVGQESPQSQAAADDVMRRAASGWDVAVVELVGFVAAAIAAAAAVRNVHGTSTPYSLPLALAVLKLPTGALTALLGLLLMRGGFVPGLSALDTSAQIIAWALVFGYAQQLFTRLVDTQAQTVLDGAGGNTKALPAPPIIAHEGGSNAHSSGSR